MIDPKRKLLQTMQHISFFFFFFLTLAFFWMTLIIPIINDGLIVTPHNLYKIMHNFI